MAVGDGLSRTPPREDGGRRGDQLNIRLTEGEMAALTGPASAAGLKVGRWLVETGLAAAEAAQARTDGELADAVDEAAKTVDRALPWGSTAEWNPQACADWSRLRAAALPVVLAEILKRPRKDT